MKSAELLIGNEPVGNEPFEVATVESAEPRRLVWASRVFSEVLVMDLSQLDLLKIWANDPNNSPLLAALRGTFAEDGLPGVLSVTFSDLPEIMTVTLQITPTTTTPE